jgi:hypothetical protein
VVFPADNLSQKKQQVHLDGLFPNGQVPAKGLVNTQRLALGAIFIYQLALLQRFQHGLDLNIGLKPFIKAI